MTDDVRYVETKVVCCDGNGSLEGLGHPKIYLNLGEQGRIECPYCSRTFIYEGDGHESH